MIKTTVLGSLLLCLMLLCVTWLQLSAQQRAQWREDLLLAIDEGNTEPLRCTIRQDTTRCAKRLLRQFVLWALSDTSEEKQAPPSEKQTESGGLFPLLPKKFADNFAVADDSPVAAAAAVTATVWQTPTAITSVHTLAVRGVS
ncbi:MAG: hypothetical protein AAF310_02635 [Myxococcota bacterium]